jgi:hypothetical protein
MSESDTNNTQPLDHWSSDDLEADADAGPKQQAPHAAQEWSSCTQAKSDFQAEPPTTSVVPTVSGGQGQDSGLLADPGHAAQDAKLVRRAIRNGWNVPDSAKPRIVGRLVTIVDQSPDDGDAIKAASVLRSMDAQDQDLAIKEHELERIDSGKATQAVQLYGREAPIDAV